jgi:hypothetical protein
LGFDHQLQFESLVRNKTLVGSDSNTKPPKHFEMANILLYLLIRIKTD